MALQKSKTLPSGVTADYWRVTRVTLDVVNESALVVLSLYVNKAARDAGMQPVQSFDYAFPFAPFVADADARSVAYEVIAAPAPSVVTTPPEEEGGEPTVTTVESNWFADAVDC